MAYDYPKYGKPRSDAERRRRHKQLHPDTKLPKRGTGKGRWRDGMIADAVKNRKS